MKSILFAAQTLALIGLSLTTVSAGPITLSSGTLTSVITYDGTFTLPTAFTINGVAILGIDNTGTGSVNIVTDFGAPAPNFTLTSTNAGISEFVTLGFDPLSLSIAPDLSFFSINATGVPGTAITDTGLAALVGTTTWVFGFTAGGPGATDITYSFVSGTANDTLNTGGNVPEPATAGLVGAGFFLLALARRRRSRT